MDQFVEIIFRHNPETMRLQVDGSRPESVMIVATNDAMAYLAGVACDFVLHAHPDQFSHSFGSEPGLTGPPVLRFEFDASLDEPRNVIPDSEVS